MLKKFLNKCNYVWFESITYEENYSLELYQEME